MNFLVENDEIFFDIFIRFFGLFYYLFEYGEVLFVVLDNIYYKGIGESDLGEICGVGGYEVWIFEV